ncbi:MAG: S41 family peptidase [Cyanobacteria bacterium P01_F01_bin.150]
MKKVTLQLSGMLSCILAFVTVWTVSPEVAIAYSDGQQLLSEAWHVVDRSYVDDTFNHQNWWKVRQKALKQPLSTPEEAYTAIEEMLSLLDDPFTRLLRPQQYQSLQTSTAGELTGVGLQLVQDLETEDLIVIAPMEGSPAQKAGIQSQDRITAIDGVSTHTFDLEEAARRMRGQIGSHVKLTILREQESHSFEIVRDRITLNPVQAELRQQDDGSKFGYIRLSQFNGNATTQMREGLQELEEQGAESYILDLRNNPGGLLQAGIDISRLWLDDGTIVYTANRNGIQDRFDASNTSLTQDRLIVLVNSGTASASEILSGALQDNHRAILVGEKTFGKGLIQSLFNLSDGSGIAVTVARYETPAHNDINKLGITPDVRVPMIGLGWDKVGTMEDSQYVEALANLQN